MISQKNWGKLDNYKYNNFWVSEKIYNPRISKTSKFYKNKENCSPKKEKKNLRKQKIRKFEKLGFFLWMRECIYIYN